MQRDGRSGVRIPVGARDFSLHQHVKIGPGAHPASYSTGIGLFLGNEADDSLPSSAEVKYEWSYTSTPPICVLSVDRENFTFFIFYLGTI
jgi:hypothetical protein